MKTVTEKALMDIAKELNGIRRGLEKSSGTSATISYSGESRDTAIDISDLIAKMMLKNAMREELERAIKYSQIVMDARKDYNIDMLYDKYGAEEDR